MRSFGQQRVAFIFFPHRAETTRLDTIPFAAHVIERLARSDCRVDVFHWSKLNSSADVGPFPDNVSLKYVSMITRNGKIKPIELTLRFLGRVGYRCVFSVGLIGSYIGGLIAAASRCPLVLLTDEFPSAYSQPRWLALARWAARRANVFVVPSDDCEPVLKEEFRLGGDKLFVTIRNAPEVTLPLAQIDWHRRMGIPEGKHLFIYAGTLEEWAQIPEILSSVSYWPEDAVLLLHDSRTRDGSGYRRQLDHLNIPGKVFWTAGLLSDDMLNSLISRCSGSFALYRNVGPTFELVGTSSGKLMRSIICRTPVITSPFASLNFVTGEGLGIQVRHPSEIPAAVTRLIKDSEGYRERCRVFARREDMLREESWNRIVRCVKQVSPHLDLLPPAKEGELRSPEEAASELLS